MNTPVALFYSNLKGHFSMNTTEAVMLAREGNADAISYLYDEYKNGIYYICLKFMNDEKDAGIVLQYTFFQAFHKLGVLKNPENFGMWLYVIAVSRCRMLLRDKDQTLFSQRGDLEKSSDLKTKFSLKNNREPKSDVEIDPKLREVVLSAAEDLPEMPHKTALLYFYCRMSTAQIAKIFETDEPAVKAHLMQAASLFKKQMTEKQQDSVLPAEFSNIENIGVIYEREAENVPVPNELSENIVATSVTLAASSAGNMYLEDRDKPQFKAAAGESNIGEKNPTDKKTLPDRQRIAFRNLVTIVIVFLIAAAVITGAIIVIKLAGDSLAMTTGVTGDDTEPVSAEAGSDSAVPISSEDVTDEPLTEPVPETTVPPPSETDPPATTPPVTDAPVTKPAETRPPVTEALAVTEDPGIWFESDVFAKEVTISKYIGSAKEVDIPPSIGGKPVTKIAPYAFQDNTAIISLKIPSSVKSIGVGAFRGCTSLTSVMFSPGLTEINDYAFLECSKLTTLKVPSTVTSVGVSAFGSTAWISAQKTSFLTVGDGVLLKYLGSENTVTVPDGIKYISNAFYYKSRVTNILLPSGVSVIGTYAFCKSPELRSITMPETITVILKDAIYDCSSLTEIKVKEGSYAETWCKNNGFASLLVYF